MSFVDGRVIRQRMEQKDARMAKKLAKTHGKLAVKRTGRHEGDPQARQADASVNSQPSHLATTAAHERSDGMTEKDPSTTPPVRTVPPFTFAEYVEEELKARGWSRDHLASQMTSYDWDLNRFVIDFMLCDPMPDGAILGEETALRLAHAFGTSKEVWLNLWEQCHPRPTHAKAVNSDIMAEDR